MFWIVSFILGVIIGQELENIPRVKPIVEVGLQKTFEYLKHYIENSGKSYPKSVHKKDQNLFTFFTSKSDERE